MKVALAFFGITRSLSYTNESIQKNILNVLKENNMEYDIYLHTYTFTGNYNNKRTKESLTIKDINNEEYKLLNPDYLALDVHEDICNRLDFSQYRSKPDPWHSNYNSVNNYILGCYSKFQLVKLIEKNNKTYDYIIYIRPDCLYNQKINMQFFNEVNDTTICIPNFHCFGPYNINDRFSICNMNNYKIYGNIFESLLDLSKKMSLHSETILGFVLKNHNINVKRIQFIFVRIRCSGKVALLDKNDHLC